MCVFMELCTDEKIFTFYINWAGRKKIGYFSLLIHIFFPFSPHFPHSLFYQLPLWYSSLFLILDIRLRREWVVITLQELFIKKNFAITNSILSTVWNLLGTHSLERFDQIPMFIVHCFSLFRQQCFDYSQKCRRLGILFTKI